MLMIDGYFSSLLKDKKNIVFIGEAGSGKSELAINISIRLLALEKRGVHLFDMDQTKPLFRTRDVADFLVDKGVVVHSHAQLMDSPVTVPGVLETLSNEDAVTLLDVGGNAVGARMVGQFSHALNNENTVVFFVINPYRPWSRDAMGITQTVEQLKRVSRIANVKLIANPNLGPTTTKEDVIKGIAKLEGLLAENENIEFVGALTDFVDDVKQEINYPILPVRLHILYPWLEE